MATNKYHKAYYYVL